MKRINVVGVSGSGKSTFGRQLATALGIPYIEMDAIYWKADWQEPEDEEFFGALTQAIRPEAWVLDGNYSRTTELKWARADTVIWINYSFARTSNQYDHLRFIRITSPEQARKMIASLTTHNQAQGWPNYD